ncbi:hypothetical protein ACFQ10_23660 [Streptomyces indonesiensis]
MITLPVRFAPVPGPGSRRGAPPAARPGEPGPQGRPGPQGQWQETQPGTPPTPPIPPISLPFATDAASAAEPPTGSEPGADPEQGEDGQKQQSILLGFLNRWRRAR